MRKHKSTRQQAAQLAAQGARELAELQHGLRVAEDSLAGLRRALKVPVLKNRRRRVIKGSRSGPSPLESSLLSSLGQLAAGGIKSEFDLDSRNLRAGGPSSFYASPSQTASIIAGLLIGKGQRVR